MTPSRFAVRKGAGVPALLSSFVRCLILAGVCFAAPLAQGQDAAKPKTSSPIAQLTIGWTYLWADQGNDYRSNLNGWFARPDFTIGKGYSAFADFTNYYGKNSRGGVNSHGFTFGIAKNVLTHPRIKPSIFAEAGDVRSSSAGTITNQLSVNAGVNLSFPIRSWVALGVTPAEYIFLYPNGDWRNDYNSKAGLVFSFGHR